MRTSIVAIVALLGLAAGDGGKIKWSADAEKSLAEAKAKGQPILMYFTQDG